jgi:hypothetical protein
MAETKRRPGRSLDLPRPEPRPLDRDDHRRMETLSTPSQSSVTGYQIMVRHVTGLIGKSSSLTSR